MTTYFFKLSDMRLRKIGAAVFFLALLATTVSSCKKDPLQGIDALPADQLLNAVTTDTFSFVFTVEYEDSLPSGRVPNAMLGTYTDPVFGTSRAGFVTQLKLSNLLQTWKTDSIVVDSVVLALDYNSSYGSLDPQSFDVYRVTEDLSTDSAYYTNSVVATEVTPIVSHTAVPDPVSSFVIDTVTEPAQLRIPLGVAFGQQLIELGNDAYASQEDWIAAFKGLQVVPTTPVQGVGEGAILMFDLTSPWSRMILYYHTQADETSRSFDWEIDDDCAQFNQFAHEFTGTEVASAVEQPTGAQNLIYVQSMAGIRTKIEIPGLQAFADSVGIIAIQKAELEMSTSGVETEFPPHEDLALRTIDSDGISAFIDDLVFEGVDHFGGRFDDNEYQMNITQYMQQLISDLQTGADQNYGLYLVSGSAQNNPNRTILLGAGNADDNMELIISYTPVN